MVRSGCAERTPTEIVEKLNREINAGLADRNAQASGSPSLAASPMLRSPAEFGKLIADETEKWAKVIRTAHIKAG